MQLDSIFILLFVTSGVLSEHTRTKRLMYAMCPPNFIGIGSLCYFISDYRVSWLEAQFDCKDKNSKLAEPVKLADKKLRRYLQEHDKERNDIWIGGTFDWQTEKWTWGYSGKEIMYNSFSQLDLGSSKDIHYHCAVLDPNQKYRWSSRSCVDQHRFVCQHKMPRVSEKNRAKVYNRWNETYPNQLANEIVLELREGDTQRVSKVIQGENSTYYLMDCVIRRHYVVPDGQRRRRMRPYHEPVTITASPPKTFKNDVHIEFIPDPLTQGVNINAEIKQNRGKSKTTIAPKAEINEIDPQTKPSPVYQKTAFDLEIEEKRRKARERRRRQERLERRKLRQQQHEQKQRDAREHAKLKAERESEQRRLQEEIEKKKQVQKEESEALKKQTEEYELEKKQSEIDQKRIQEIEEEKENEAREHGEIRHKQIANKHEQQHKDWRKYTNEDKEGQNNDEQLRFIKLQEEEFRKMEELRKAEERKKLDEDLARLKQETKLREERQKKREEEIKRRQELLKQQEEEEKRLQEEIKRQEEEARKAKEEEERRKEEERKQKEAEELRRKVEREERIRQRKLKRQRSEAALEERRKKQSAFRERLAKLSPEEQYIFFKRREERNKRKRLAQINKANEVPIPE